MINKCILAASFIHKIAKECTKLLKYIIIYRSSEISGDKWSC